uniref:recombinase family protein n=1 Tax=Rhodococcus qingshengii TaxID=334542 RepID=UPI001C4E291B|nr:recombinase family protein [Rhodococcus qingshengii]
MSGRVGRPMLCPLPVLRRILVLRNEGKTMQYICDELNDEGIPTPAGKVVWGRNNISRLLKTAVAEEIRQEPRMTEVTSIFGEEVFPQSGERRAA